MWPRARASGFENTGAKRPLARARRHIALLAIRVRGREDGPVSETPQGQFPTTRWSVIQTIRDEVNGEQQRALNELCEIYWPALFACARGRGQSPEDAEDLTQGFLVTLLKRGNLGDVTPQRTKFRSFLLTAFQRFMVSEWRKKQSLKRGADRLTFSIDGAEAERAMEIPDGRATPEQCFERAWAARLSRSG